ncbi:hypothetical protein A4X03_0g9920, partial [Tilletia caries]
RSGLETDDVALAHAIVTVPINPEFGSLNLAQAVILLAYEWSKGQALAQPPEVPLDPPAPHGELEGLIDHLTRDLDAAGYFFPPDRRTMTLRTLRTALTKTGWSHNDIRMMRGVITALGRKLRTPEPAADTKPAASKPAKPKLVCRSEENARGRIPKRVCKAQEDWNAQPGNMTDDLQTKSGSVGG